MGDDNFDGLSFILWFWGIIAVFMVFCILTINTNGGILVIAGIGAVIWAILNAVKEVIRAIKKRKEKHHGENNGTKKRK